MPPERGEQVGLRGAHQAHRGRRTVLLVVGVQDEQHVEGLGDLGIDLVGLGGEAEGHPEEVLHQAQRVVRVQERLAGRLLVRIGRDGGQLREQSDGGQLDLLGVLGIERILVVGAQRVHGAGEHRHRVRVTREAVEEAFEVLVQQRVPPDLVGEILELRRRRELPVDQQIAHLDEGGLLGELLDRDAPVAQDALVAVDVGDGRLGGRGVDEAAVEGRQSGFGEEFAERNRVTSLGGLQDRELQLSTGVGEGC